ncbi:MAG: hypothetical protein H6617_02275 [Bdellovibrionaceae bacterium]|nr:hypothetical protein [Pseudobdellovibrionaceae bacterium]
MIALWRHFLIHLFRTRLFYLCMGLSFFAFFIPLKLADAITIHVQEMEQAITGENIFLILFFVAMSLGGFISMVYGVWVVPYLHQGPRVFLSFGLPVAKWKVPIAYALTFLCLIALQNTIMFTLHGFMFGYEAYQDGFPLKGLLMVQLFQILSLEVTMFLFATLALFFGRIAATVLGTAIFSIAQVCGFIFATDLGAEIQSKSAGLTLVRHIYEILPPWDKVLVRITQQLKEANIPDPQLIPWGIWLVLLGAAFVVGLRFPLLTKGTD